MIAVPRDRPLDAVFERHRRAPAAALSQPGGIDVLLVDLALGVARSADLGLHPGPGQPGDRLDDLEHAVRPLAAGVEGGAADVIAVERVGDREVGPGGVLDVEQVADRRAVGAQHRRAALDGGADRFGNQTGEVEVAAAVDVGEAGHRHRQAVRRPVGARDQFSGGLGRLVRRRRLQRELLAVGKLVVRAVGLVGGGEDDPLDPLGPAGLEQRPGTADVRLEAAARVGLNRADDRLGGEVEDGVDSPPGDRPSQQVRVEEIALEPLDRVLDLQQRKRRGPFVRTPSIEARHLHPALDQGPA